MSLEQWQRNGWLTPHTPSREEIADLLAAVDRDLASARTPGLHADWRLNIAYNAALQCAVTALAACGYRATREAHHFRVIESLALTLGSQFQTSSDRLNEFRKKRNISTYARPGVTSEKEVAEMMNLARNLRTQLKTWLKANNPALL